MPAANPASEPTNVPLYFWHLADSMTAELVIEALKKTILRERLPTGMILHSDRGGQYVDTEFRGLLNQHGFEQSMSRADETYDNAHAVFTVCPGFLAVSSWLREVLFVECVYHNESEKQ